MLPNQFVQNKVRQGWVVADREQLSFVILPWIINFRKGCFSLKIYVFFTLEWQVDNIFVWISLDSEQRFLLVSFLMLSAIHQGLHLVFFLHLQHLSYINKYFYFF